MVCLNSDDVSEKVQGLKVKLNLGREKEIRFNN